jgi:transposase InsO family protein
MKSDRLTIIELIQEARDAGARQSKACDIIGISAKTLQRWSIVDNNNQDGRIEAKHHPINKLNDIEYQQVINVANEPEYSHLSPSKIVPTLADKGIYIASESTFYRILTAEKQLKHRQKAKPVNQVKKPKALCATAPNQLYSWDITYLPTQVKGIFLYLYLVMDIFSRKIVGWQVYTNESSARAADLMRDICHREHIKPNQVILHSDNGSPMKGATMLATLQQLGIVPSFSRPSVSNDNPYSESLFRILKYRPEYPENPFIDITDARQWVQGFANWYNKEHLHSEIQFVTPEQRHNGEDIAILAQRKVVYQAAKLKNPKRWSGNIRNWQPVTEVYLNPEKKDKEELKEKAA